MFRKEALVFAFMFSPQFVYSSSEYVWEQVGLDIDGQDADDQSGVSVALSSDGKILAIGSENNDDGGTDSGHVRVFKWKKSGSGFAWSQIGDDIDGENAIDRSGYAIDLKNNGTTLAIGAYGNDDGGGNSGHVKVYNYDGSAWTPMGDAIPGMAFDDVSGRVSLSNDGKIVAIGSPQHDGGNGANSGHARVYEWKDENGDGTYAWELKGNDIDGDYAGDKSSAVVLSSDGTILAVGARGHDENYSADSDDDRGHVKVFEWKDENGDGTYAWEQKGSDIDGEAAGDQSGQFKMSLSSDGTILAIGAHLNDGNGTDTDSGHVRVFEWKDENGDGTYAWEQKGTDIDGEATGDQSGRSVALSSDGSILAVGAQYHDEDYSVDSDNDRGYVKVYEWSGSAWEQIGDDIDGDAAGDQSGCSVALSSDGTMLAVGAIENDGNGVDSGHVRVYKLKSPGKILQDLEQLQDETISQIGFSFGQFSGVSAVPFTSVASAKSFTVGDNLAHRISVQLEYKPRIMIRNSNDLKSLEGSASMNLTQNLAMGLDLGIIKKHSGAAVQSAAQIDNHIIKVGVNSYYLADAQSKRYYQVGASLNSGKMDLSRQGVALGTESGHGIADVSILSAIGGYHTNLTNWSLPEYQVDLVGRLSRVTRDAYDEANDIVNALSYDKFYRDELDVNLSVSRGKSISKKVNLTLGSTIQGTLVLHRSDATMTEQANPSNTWTISPAIEHQARASVYTSLGYKASDSLWVNLNLSAQRDAFNKHNTAYFSVSVSF